MHSSCIFFILTVLIIFVRGQDVCGNGECESTENSFWCSQDCGGACGDSLCSRDEPATCSECQCSETEEEKLGRLINEYRAEAGLPAIPIGVHMTTVARAHVRDSVMSNPHGTDGCNMHSWSSNTFDGFQWTSCCYTPDHARASCIWDKPRELTPLTGNGFENSASGYATVELALEGWKNSPGHNSVIMNLGIWEDMDWKFMGVGVTHFEQNFYHVWFYANTDDIVKESDCVQASTPSASPSTSTIPVSPSASPSSSTAIAEPMITVSSSPIPSATPSASVSSFIVAPGTLDCDSDDQLFRLSMIQVEKSDKTTVSNVLELWSGQVSAITNPQAMIQLQKVPISFVSDKTKIGKIRFESCSNRIFVRYYNQDGSQHRRRKGRKINSSTHMAHDKLKKVVRKVFGRKGANASWISAYIRMEVWVGRRDKIGVLESEQTMTFKLEATN